MKNFARTEAVYVSDKRESGTAMHMSIDPVCMHIREHSGTRGEQGR